MMAQNTLVSLEQLGKERDRLLDRVTRLLKADAHIAAAWLSGSFGRSEEDAWSDLDLHVVVQDDAYPMFRERPETLYAACGEPLLVFGGMPSNSMPGGYFWLVQYAPFMLEVDWNIGPLQEAARPQASVVLFDHEGIPTAPPLSPVSDEERRRVADTQLRFFWAMAPIGIKHAGRGHTRRALDQVQRLGRILTQLWYCIHRPERLQPDAYEQNRPLDPELDAQLRRPGPVLDPPAMLETIRFLCRKVEELHPALADLGATVDERVVDEVAALADLAAPLAAAGGSAAHEGSRR